MLSYLINGLFSDKWSHYQIQLHAAERRNKQSPPGGMGNIFDVNASKAIDTHAVKKAATTSSQVWIHL